MINAWNAPTKGIKALLEESCQMTVFSILTSSSKDMKHEGFETCSEGLCHCEILDTY